MKALSVNKAVEIDTRRAGFLALETIFFMLVVVAFWGQVTTIDPFSFVLLALATVRMARTLSFNEVAEPLRAPFTEVKPDSCGAGADVHPRGDGLQYVIGSLLACPICTSTWSALILFVLWVLAPGIGKPLVYVLAIAGASEQLHYLAGLTEWAARLSRVQSGKISPDQDS